MTGMITKSSCIESSF